MMKFVLLFMCFQIPDLDELAVDSEDEPNNNQVPVRYLYPLQLGIRIRNVLPYPDTKEY